MMRILIADDHKMIRDGIRLLADTSGRFNVVGEARNGAEAVLLAAQLAPDVVLMDIDMPELNGIEATKQIVAANPAQKVVALTMFDDSDEYLAKMIEAGARGYILKRAGLDELIKALDAVEQGEFFLSKAMLPHMINSISRQSSAAKQPKTTERSAANLTKREVEVVKLIADGLTNSEIAEKLFVSTRTVENHRSNLLQKTGAKNTAALVMYAIQNGIIKA